MDWMPNEDGVRWFANEVLPLLRQRRPAVKFTVVGRDPNPDLRALGRALGIGVTGTVPDVRPYLARAGVVVVPLRIGGGTRLKIFEAMSMSKAVVSTTVGAEGLALEDGAHLRLADEPGTFAAAIDEVLGDRNTARRLGRQAAEFVRARFSWEASGEAFERACLSAVERKHQGAVRP
jgi:glycosyltransferase involved in cell wall biosynthesis